MYPFGSRERGISRRTRDILIIVLCLLLALNILQYVLNRSTATRDVDLRNALVTRVRSDIDNALGVASQLSRTGGSNTQRYLAETRQYLYGVTQLNDLTNTLFGGGQMLVPQATVNDAVSAVDACESRRQEGLALDTPLSQLWQLLNELSAAVAVLG